MRKTANAVASLIEDVLRNEVQPIATAANTAQVTAVQAGTAAAAAQSTADAAEPALGNPAADNYILSSNTAGVRLWVPRVSTATPQALSVTPAPGMTGEASDAGHVHAMPTATQVGAVPTTGGTFTGAVAVERLNVGTATGAATGQVRASGDVLALNDSGGLFTRNVNMYQVPTDHFAGASLDPAWQWAGTPFGGTPSAINLAAFPSLLRLVHSNTTSDFFAWRTGSQIYARCAVLLDSYIGVRVDDHPGNNAVEIRLQASVGPVTISTRHTVAGVTTVTTHYAENIPEFYVLRAQVAAGSFLATFIGKNTPILSNVFVASPIPWTATRAGLTFGQRAFASNNDRAGFFDWALII
jgi:hypothetical protein